MAATYLDRVELGPSADWCHMIIVPQTDQIDKLRKTYRLRLPPLLESVLIVISRTHVWRHTSGPTRADSRIFVTGECLNHFSWIYHSAATFLTDRRT